MPTNEPYYDENPLKYVGKFYKAALAYTNKQKSRLQEQWDMYLAYDEYIEDRRANNRSALSFPLIFSHIEARVATLQEILNTSENFIRFEPIVPGDPVGEIAAERLEAGFANIRADLEWDEKFTEMFQANEIFDYNWISLEAQTIPIRPETGVVVEEGLIGTEKLYPSFELYAPARILIDGDYEREHKIPAKFKMIWMSYQELKGKYPERTELWLMDQKKAKSDSAGDGVFHPGDWSSRAAGTESTATTFGSESGSENSEPDGFLVCEAHISAVFKDGTVRDRILVFLPEVTTGPPSSGRTFPDGYPIDEGPKPFDNVDNMIFMTRGRPLPYTPKGKGTSDLLVPFQRDFSEQISTERDLDRLLQAPPMAMRSQMYIGKERPTMDPYEIWNFKDTAETAQLPVSHFVSPINVATPNRQWAMATNTKIQNLMNLVSAAVEAETGGVDVNPNKTATAFSGRARAANRRIMIPFHQQARAIQRIVRSMLAMMGEAPTQFLYPHIRAGTSNPNVPGVLLPEDIMAAVHVRVPSLAQYANREMQKVMWRMVAEGAGQFAVTQNSPAAQVMLIENMLRSMEIGEEKVQEFKAMVASDLGMANEQAQAFQKLLIIQNQKAPPAAPAGTGSSSKKSSTPQVASQGGRMGPGQVTKTANLTTYGIG